MSEPAKKPIKLRNLIKPKSHPNLNQAKSENERLPGPNLKQKAPPKRNRSPQKIQQSQTIPSIPESFKESYSDVRNSPSFSADIKRIADKITSYRYKSSSHRCRRCPRNKPY